MNEIAENLKTTIAKQEVELAHLRQQLSQAQVQLIVAKEKAEQASKLKSEFAMNMGHDIRTPLNGIVGLAQILGYQEKDATKKEFLNDILSSAVSLTALLSEIIELANLETFGVAIEENKFNLNEIVTELFTLMNAQARHKNIQLIADFPADLPTCLISDKLRVHRILLNLLGNALKFTERGSITISAEIMNKTQDQITLALSVKDTGIGMPKDKLATIFEKFNRLTVKENDFYAGNGLGLYIVKQFLTELNGKTTVESEEGKGSKFTCTLAFKYL